MFLSGISTEVFSGFIQKSHPGFLKGYSRRPLLRYFQGILQDLFRNFFRILLGFFFHRIPLKISSLISPGTSVFGFLLGFFWHSFRYSSRDMLRDSFRGFFTDSPGISILDFQSSSRILSGISVEILSGE